MTNLTGSSMILVGKVVDAGEIAIMDHRSSQPYIDKLKLLAVRKTRDGGMDL